MTDFTYYSLTFEKDFSHDEDENEFTLIMDTLAFDREVCTTLDGMLIDYVNDTKLIGKFVSKILRFSIDDAVDINSLSDQIQENLDVKTASVSVGWQKPPEQNIGTDQKRTVGDVFTALFPRNPTINTVWRLKGGRKGVIVAVDESGRSLSRKGVLTQDSEGLWHVEDVADQLIEMTSRSPSDFVIRQ